MLISKETHIICDFPGDPDPFPPLDPHMPEDVRQEGSKISNIIHRENFLVGKIIHNTVYSECYLHGRNYYFQ